MIAERIAEKCTSVPIAGCVLWTGYSTADGYGRIRHQGRMRMVHRLAYELAYGAIPIGKMVLHRCDTPCCCNPHHLFLGTNRDNVLDMVSKNRNCAGERHRSAKLTKAQVIEIRALREQGVTAREIAKRFGIKKSSAWAVASGKSWKSVQ